MSTEDAVSDPKEPEGTEVSTETTETAAAPAGDSPKTDMKKSSAGETEKAGGSTKPDTSTTGADESSDASGVGEADRSAETKEPVAEAADSGEKVGLDKPSVEESAETGKTADSGAKVGLDKGSADETAEADTDDKPAAPAKPAAGKRSALTRGRVLFVAAAVLLIAAMVAVGILAFQSTDRRQELDRRAAATKAACDFGHNFATYTGDKVDDYLTRLDQSATGEWKKLVAEIGPDLKARFAERQVSSSASDVQCGYESGSDNKARVVLIIDQSFTTADSATPGQVKVAANVDMEKVGDRWMVANFDTPMVQQ